MRSTERIVSARNCALDGSASNATIKIKLAIARPDLTDSSFAPVVAAAFVSVPLLSPPLQPPCETARRRSPLGASIRPSQCTATPARHARCIYQREILRTYRLKNPLPCPDWPFRPNWWRLPILVHWEESPASLRFVS